jgi:hypothetical protein
MACSDPAGCLGLWLAMLCYAREQLTDGLVPARYAVGMWGDKKNVNRLRDMTDHGLLEDRGKEFFVCRYAPRNQTKAMVEESRSKARKRMAGLRAKRAGCSPDVRANERGTFAENVAHVPIYASISTSGSLSRDQESSKTATGDPSSGVMLTEPVRSAPDPYGESFIVSSWCSGVRSVTGGPACTEPRGQPRLGLIEAVKAHAPSGSNLSEWTQQAAAEFARLGGTLSSLRFVDWLNSGRPEPRSTTSRQLKQVGDPNDFARGGERDENGNWVPKKARTA